MHYTATHEWVKKDGEAFRIGITDWAQRELGEIVFIEMPKAGERLKKGDVLCVIETTKAAADIYCPFDGVVESINAALVAHPQLINKSAEAEGWIVQMSGEPSELLDREGYRALTELPSSSLQP